VQFFPEGGDLVQELVSNIAIKATNLLGQGIEVKGKLIDEKGIKIAEIGTSKNGFGQFSLKPKIGVSYTFEGLYEGDTIKETLPAALSEGVVLRVDNSREDNIQLQILTNNPAILAGGYLVGQGMGQVFFEEKLTEQAKIGFEIDVTEMPAGILQFTLFDKLGQPRAERLVFNHHNINNFNVDITTNQRTYNKREKVQVQLDIYNDEGETIGADLSLSVVDKSLERVNFNKDNIQSYLWLSSDIKGVIENPIAYFKDTKPTTKKALDLLLMTQGWRRFKWQDALKKPTKEIIYSPEQGLSLSGKITKKNKNNKPVKAVGYLSELSTSFKFLPFETDEAGAFSIENLDVIDDTDMVLQAATFNKKQQKVKKGDLTLKGSRNINIALVEKSPMFIGKKEIDVQLIENHKQTAVQGLSNLENIQYKNDVAYNEIDGWSIELDAVSVTAKKIDKVIEYYEDGMLYKRPDTRIRMDEVTNPNAHNNLLSILRRAPGLMIDNGGVIIRGRQTGLSNITISNNARFMVNGALVSDKYATSINPSNIAFIDVVRSFNKLNMYGEVGNNGLVMVYLKTPQDQESKEKEAEGIKSTTDKEVDEIIEYYENKMLYEKPDSRVKINEVMEIDTHKNILTVLVEKVPKVSYDVSTRAFNLGENVKYNNKIIKVVNLNTIVPTEKTKFMVNGAFVPQDYAMSLNLREIAFVDVLLDFSKLSKYNELDSDGLIMIYLSPPKIPSHHITNIERDGIVNFTFNGYNQARAFYAPVYNDLNIADNKYDNRVTLHWIPAIQFNKLGEAYIEFYTSDRTGTFDILVEGISENGLPIVGASKIIVK